jgi:hypothetical protein
MRVSIVILVLACAALCAGLLIERNRQAQISAQLVHSNDLLQLRAAELAAAQQKLSECSSNLRVSALSADELRRRGNVVATADVWIELICVRAGDGHFDPATPVTLSTKIQLSTASGVTYTFVNRRLEPLSFVTEDPEHFRILLNYEPLNTNEVIGRPIQDFSGITMLTTHYNGVLHAIGLQVAPDGLRALTFNINELEAVKVQGFHAEINPPGDIAWNVSRSFANILANYGQAVQQRIATRAATETSGTTQ